MQHSFDVEIATEYGQSAAVILNNLYFWVEKNRANEQNFFDGTYWTYCSVEAFGELFPYLSPKAIRTALDKLIDAGLVATGNYNKSAYDRTKWYSITEKGYSILTKGQIHLPKTANGSSQKGEPIPDINTDNKPDNIKDKKEGRSYERPKKETKAGADAPVIADAMTDASDLEEPKGEETKERNPAKRESGDAPENPPAEEKSDFDVFWDAYPNRKGKGQARAAFDRALKKTNLQTILKAIEEQKKTDQWKKEKGRYIPHPATWLNGERWEDETANISSKYDYEDGGWSL